jgi:hypothetical protein
VAVTVVSTAAAAVVAVVAVVGTAAAKAAAAVVATDTAGVVRTRSTATAGRTMTAQAMDESCNQQMPL